MSCTRTVLIALCINLSSRKDLLLFLSRVRDCFPRAAIFSIAPTCSSHLPSLLRVLGSSSNFMNYTHMNCTQVVQTSSFEIAPRVVMVYVDVRKLDAIVYALMQKRLPLADFVYSTLYKISNKAYSGRRVRMPVKLA